MASEAVPERTSRAMNPLQRNSSEFLRALMLLFTISSMAEKPTIKSATVKFIKRRYVFFSTDLNFQNTIMVMIFPTMINKDSTAKITVQKNNSAVLHIVVVFVFPEEKKFRFIHYT